MLVHMSRQHLCECIFAGPRRALKSYHIHIRESPNKCAIKLKTRNPTKNLEQENRPWCGRCSPRGNRYEGGSNRPMAALEAGMSTQDWASAQAHHSPINTTRTNDLSGKMESNLFNLV